MVFSAQMNQSFLRQRLRVLNNDKAKSSQDDSANEQEYSGESPLNRIHKSQANPVHKEDVSSPSPYDSCLDSGNETDGDASAAVAAASVSQQGAPSVSRVLSPAASREDNGEEKAASKAWYEFDVSLVLALVSPIGNWLTGGDHVKNLLLILLLIFYLHQIIEGELSCSLSSGLHAYKFDSSLEPLPFVETAASPLPIVPSVSVHRGSTLS